MKTAFSIEKNSTARGIETLGLSEMQRSRALADFAVADALVGAFFAVSKLLHLR
jgi:hypothetical protein